MSRVLITLAAALLAIALGRDGWDAWVARTDLPATLADTSVEMVDRDGTLLRAFDVENGRLRLAVEATRVDPAFVEMLIAYEDKRFWQHGGVDGRAVLRASAQAVIAGRVVSGASTLTMQTARLLENSGTGTVRGKIRQMRLAWALERQLSKAEILHLYLQHAPYGGRLEGVRSATFAWFGKEPTRLSPAEAALLVALPQAPEARRPDRNPAAARAARDRVLARVGGPRPPDPVPQRMQAAPRRAPHLADHLRRVAPQATRLHTTVSAPLQRQMEALAQIHAGRAAPGVTVALMVADHRTGAVLARVGGAQYADRNGVPGFVDMTRASRSPGSTLKPLIYALAFDRGLAHPETVFADAPTRFGRYAPQNFDGVFRGDVTARQALAQSLNIPPVALTHALGPARLMQGLRSFGTTPDLPGHTAGLAVALGGVGLSLEELVQVYAGLAQLGVARPLHDLARDAAPRGAAVLSPRAAWQVGDILRGIAPPPGAPGGLAYKTGTSYGHRDAWAIGYDGRHVVGVWMGRPDGTPVPGAFGGTHAAPLLFEVFGRLAPTLHPPPAAPPDTLMLGTAALPPPLRRFGPARAGDGALAVAFPPEGAVLMSGPSVVKVAGGRLPLTVLLNGKPVAVRVQDRTVPVDLSQRGFSDIAVIDATGRAARVSVETRP